MPANVTTGNNRINPAAALLTPRQPPFQRGEFKVKVVLMTIAVYHYLQWLYITHMGDVSVFFSVRISFSITLTAAWVRFFT